jgi:hypothetical protein
MTYFANGGWQRANQKSSPENFLPRFHHDHPERRARRVQSAMQRRWQPIKRNPFHASVSVHIWGHKTSLSDGHTITFRCYPNVTITKTPANESNSDVLVKVIRRKFGIETFTSRELSERAETDEELRLALGGRLGISRIGTMLRDIKSIEVVDYERHIASWRVGPSRE